MNDRQILPATKAVLVGKPLKMDIGVVANHAMALAKANGVSFTRAVKDVLKGMNYLNACHQRQRLNSDDSDAGAGK